MCSNPKHDRSLTFTNDGSMTLKGISHMCRAEFLTKDRYILNLFGLEWSLDDLRLYIKAQ